MQITPFYAQTLSATPSLSCAVCWVGWEEKGTWGGKRWQALVWSPVYSHAWSLDMWRGGKSLVGWLLVFWLLFVFVLWITISQMLCPKILGGAMPSAHWVMPSCAMGLSKLLYVQNVSQGACRQACPTTSAYWHFFVIERCKFRHNYVIFHINSICYLKEIEWICFNRLAQYRSCDARWDMLLITGFLELDWFLEGYLGWICLSIVVTWSWVCSCQSVLCYRAGCWWDDFWLYRDKLLPSLL